jgi:hypothetical protein
MKIPEKFYQFKGEKALIVISGTEEAKIFKASNGDIEFLQNIKAREVSYSDREGFFESRRQGMTFRSGSTMKDVDQKEKKDFLETLAEEFRKLNGEYDYIVLTAPEHALPEIIDSLGIPSDKVQDVVRIAKKGTYLKYSAEELLELLTDALNPLAG